LHAIGEREKQYGHVFGFHAFFDCSAQKMLNGTSQLLRTQQCLAEVILHCSPSPSAGPSGGGLLGLESRDMPGGGDRESGNKGPPSGAGLPGSLLGAGISSSSTSASRNASVAAASRYVAPGSAENGSAVASAAAHFGGTSSSSGNFLTPQASMGQSASRTVSDWSVLASSSPPPGYGPAGASSGIGATAAPPPVRSTKLITHPSFPQSSPAASSGCPLGGRFFVPQTSSKSSHRTASPPATVPGPGQLFSGGPNGFLSWSGEQGNSVSSASPLGANPGSLPTDAQRHSNLYGNASAAPGALLSTAGGAAVSYSDGSGSSA
ncbi:unnamed protein product, partial [Amoebophrya sp. A25]